MIRIKSRRRLPTAIRLGFLTMMMALAGSVASAAQDQAVQPPTPASPTADAPQNALCPVLPDEAIDSDVFTEYDGRRVYFCCRKCLRKFERDPSSYLATLASLRSGSAGPVDSGNGALEHEHEHEGASPEPDAVHDDQGPKEHATHVHEHSTPHAIGLAKFIRWLGNFHPPMVNFPIGLLTAAAVAELLLALTKRPTFAAAVNFCVWFGGIGAIAAAVLGWFFGGFHLVDDDWILTTHRWVGTSTALWALLLLWLNLRSQTSGREGGRQTFRAALFAGAGLASAAGFLGGAMVYGIDHYAW